jgi:hypothetical protein
MGPTGASPFFATAVFGPVGVTLPSTTQPGGSGASGTECPGSGTLPAPTTSSAQITFLSSSTGIDNVPPPPSGYQYQVSGSVSIALSLGVNQNDNDNEEGAYVYPCVMDGSGNLTQFPQYALAIDTIGNATGDDLQPYQTTLSVSGGGTVNVATTTSLTAGVCMVGVCPSSSQNPQWIMDYPTGADSSGAAYISGFIQATLVVPPS